MNVLWQRGEASVHDIQAALKGKPRLAYTTVLSTLRTMAGKGYVGHRKEGRAFIFYPLMSEREARDTAIRTLMRSFFGGSPRAFAQHLVRDSEIGREDLDALMEEILAAEREGRHE